MADGENAPATTITTKTVTSNADVAAVKMKDATTVEINGSSEVNGICGEDTTKDNTEVKASKVEKLDDKTIDSNVDDTAAKMEETAKIIVNGTSEVNGICEDTSENNTEVKTGKVEKLEVNDVKQDIGQENINLVEKQPVVPVEGNVEATVGTGGNAEVVIRKTEEAPQKDPAVENGLVEDSSTEKNASVEKTMENGEVPLSEAASETPAEKISEPIDESKAEAATQSVIETITGTEAEAATQSEIETITGTEADKKE